MQVCGERNERAVMVTDLVSILFFMVNLYFIICIGLTVVALPCDALTIALKRVSCSGL